MSGKIKLLISSTANHKPKELVLEENNTLVLGQADDCNLRFNGDQLVSRHHCVIEVNPPDARIRDIGSLNGTYVNGTKIGGRERHETPEEGKQREHPTIDLHDGDQIKLGSIRLDIKVEVNQAVQEEIICGRCGRNVSKEAGKYRQGDYVCQTCRQELKADPMELLAMLFEKAKPRQQQGQQFSIPDYDIEKKLGQGGMGAVYLARHKTSHQLVALKVMLSQVAVDQHARDCFKREIETTRELHHKNIVDFIDWGQSGSFFYFLIEYCNGGSADALMAQYGGRIPLNVAAPIMLDTLNGLAYAHAHGKVFVHRDLKPPNILLVNKDGRISAKVADMGLAKSSRTAGISGMTTTGTVAGTMVYMPKDQLVDYVHTKPVSDVWSIAATFYHMLTAELPRPMYLGQSPIEMVLHNEAIPIRKRNSQIPKDLAEVIDHALTIDDRKRYQNAGEMLTAMKKVL
jgi:hypothetical protein